MAPAWDGAALHRLRYLRQLVPGARGHPGAPRDLYDVSGGADDVPHLPLRADRLLPLAAEGRAQRARAGALHAHALAARRAAAHMAAARADHAERPDGFLGSTADLPCLLRGIFRRSAHAQHSAAHERQRHGQPHRHHYCGHFGGPCAVCGLSPPLGTGATAAERRTV